MPLYDYRGLKTDGRSTKGSVDAENQRAARSKLKKEGVFVTELKDRKSKSIKTSGSALLGSKSVGVQDLALMTRQLATLVKANIPLVDALTGVSEQIENPSLSEAVSEIKNLVNEGSPFYRALSKYPQIFDNIFVSMCEAGEMSGTLDVILIRLAEFTESQNDLNNRVRSALTYPIIMVVVSLGLIFFLFTYLIPQMMQIFESMPNMSLPWYSLAVMQISQFAVAFWPILMGILIFFWLAFWNWKRSESGAKSWDAISLRLPLFGEILRLLAVARFTRTLATLLTGGVPMLQALSIVRNVVNNHVLAVAVDEARGNISEGESIAGPLKKSGQFPPLLIHMVNIGEKTGDLENMLIQVADAYDFQVKTKVERLTASISPIILVFMAAIILIVVVSIFVPMFEIQGNLG
ncbi:MAG: type II secretion system F family protein [Bdellovibrio sp.]